MTLAPIRSIFDSKPPFVREAGGIGRVEFNARSADVSVARRGALGEGEAIRETRAVIVEWMGFVVVSMMMFLLRGPESISFCNAVRWERQNVNHRLFCFLCKRPNKL